MTDTDRSIIGFCGSRSLPAGYQALVTRVARRASAQGNCVATGCANGADAFVRAAVPSAWVFAVSSGAYGQGRSSFARRSSDLIRAISTAGPGSAFVGFATIPCPPGISPARSWRSGKPASGTWSELALAIGLGIPTFVFWCRPASRPDLPTWERGEWIPISNGSLDGSHLWDPPAAMLPGFNL